MKPKIMTANDWLKLAERQMRGSNALCFAAKKAEWKGYYRDTSISFIGKAMEVDWNECWWPEISNVEDWDRADFCLLMRAMGTKEYRELAEWAGWGGEK